MTSGSELNPEDKQKVIAGYELPFDPTTTAIDLDEAHSLVFYESKAAQTKRFEILCRIAKFTGQTIGSHSWLDVGCGLGNLHDYLTAVADDFDYLGTDITPSLIFGAKQLHPGVAFQELDILTDPVTQHDFVVACGIFTDAITDNFSHLKNMVDKMLELAHAGVAFNFLIAQSRLSYQWQCLWHKLSGSNHIQYDTPDDIDEADLYFYDRKQLLRHFKVHPKVARARLATGYIPGDATIYLAKG